MKKLLPLIAVALIVASPSQAATSEQAVTQGKKLDCTIVRPWATSPASTPYTVIFWANGWGSQNSDVTAGYLLGLRAWSEAGNYIVVAANSRSPRESDVTSCANWIVEQSNSAGSEYFGRIAFDLAGVAGHSQGGGVAIKVAGSLQDFGSVSVLAMTPYASNWNGADAQTGPAFIMAGTADDVAPAGTYATPAWQQIKAGGQGGVYGKLIGGDHNTDAWGPEGQDPTQFDFGRFQSVSELWWRYTLEGDLSVGPVLRSILDGAEWNTVYHLTPSFSL